MYLITYLFTYAMHKRGISCWCLSVYLSVRLSVCLSPSDILP